MPRLIFHDKAGNTEVLEAAPGQPIRQILRAHGIPSNAVLTWVNGELSSEDSTVPDEGDRVEVKQVRPYDLNVTRRPPQRKFNTSGTVYTKSVLFDRGGNIEVQSEQFDEAAFVDYVERTFVDSVLSKGLIAPGREMVVGLSGGRDSVAFLTLLKRTRALLPPLRLTAVTITGLPDWEEPMTFGAAKASCRALDIDHTVVDARAVEKVFRLSRPFVDIMSDIVRSEAHPITMVVTHHVMRRMLEVAAAERGISTVVLGLNSDDLVASLVTWFTSGFQMGPIPERRIGPFDFVFPLYRITKKELTLYLELVAPELNRQGAPGRFTVGPGERSLAYAVTDHLYDLWPGIDYFLFNAFEHIQATMLPKVEGDCRRCGATIVMQEGEEPGEVVCDVCQLFGKFMLSEVV